MTRQQDIQRILEDFKVVKNIPGVTSAKKRVLITKIKNEKKERSSRLGREFPMSSVNSTKKNYDDNEQEETEQEIGENENESSIDVHSSNTNEMMRIPEITTEELQTASNKLKKGKSPDSNGIRAEDIKASLYMSLKNDVGDMQWSLAADQELAAKLAESCSSQSSEWEERQESRAGEGAPCESRTSRKTHALFTSVNLGMWLVACIRDVLGQVVMWFTWCSVHVVAHVVVLCSSCPMACHKSGADRCGADRRKPCAADLGRCAACATGARAVSRRGAGRGCASATDPGGNRGACCW